MYPEVNKTVTGIHDFQKWLQASGPLSHNSGVSSSLPPF